MRKRPWSVARLMSAIAILAIGLTVLLALRTRQEMDDPGVGILALALALILAAAADRALFGPRGRAFWLGFTAMGWLCAAGTHTHPQETRSYLLRYGPSLVRARDEYRDQRVAAS